MKSFGRNRQRDQINGAADTSTRNEIDSPPEPPFESDTIIEALAAVALQPYLTLEENAAVATFMTDWRETSFVHETGHIFGTQAGLELPSQSGEEEALAYLTELRYGGVPHYTLRNMLSMETSEDDRPHGAGARIVFSEFARLTGNDGIVYELPGMHADEIRVLADRVFEDRYRPRMKE